jgi:hypothetical protein
VAVPAENCEVLCRAIAPVLVYVMQVNALIPTHLASSIRGIPHIEGDLSMFANSLIAVVPRVVLFAI